MRTHSPWQPHMSNTPLFSPNTPAGHSPYVTTLDHFDLIEEEGETAETEAEEKRDQMSDSPLMKGD